VHKFVTCSRFFVLENVEKCFELPHSVNFSEYVCSIMLMSGIILIDKLLSKNIPVMYFWSVNYYRNSATASLLLSMSRVRAVRISIQPLELTVAGGKL